MEGRDPLEDCRVGTSLLPQRQGRPDRQPGPGRLARRVAPVPVRLCDERLTTVSAESILRDQGRRGARRRAVVDQAAAVLILQTALDTERSSGHAPGEIVEVSTDE